MFVKGGLCLIKGMSTFLQLLTFEQCWSGKGHADVWCPPLIISSLIALLFIRSLLLITVSGQQHQTLRNCRGKKGEFGYKYKAICFLLNNNRICAMNIVSCCINIVVCFFIYSEHMDSLFTFGFFLNKYSFFLSFTFMMRMMMISLARCCMLSVYMFY